MNIHLPPTPTSPPQLPLNPQDFHVARRAHFMLGEVVAGRMTPQMARALLRLISKDTRRLANALKPDL